MAEVDKHQEPLGTSTISRQEPQPALQDHRNASSPTKVVRGFDIHAGMIDRELQEKLVTELRGVARKAPLFSPMTPYGKRMSVRMTSAGKYGWCSDSRGYRYETFHPSGVPWPPIPATILGIWHDVTGLKRMPDCCLVNHYGQDARMGMHQDCDEADFSWPVVSISLGDDALFRIGNLVRGGGTESLWLHSGDVVVMGGEARLTYHGIDRIKHGSCNLLTSGGRINLTLRIVD